MRSKLILVSLLLVSLLAGGCLGKFYQYKKSPPRVQREGTIKLPQLQGKVEIYFDDKGIPQVFADKEHDLFFAIGWLQAQDRLFEMVLLRAMAEGRLTELLGDLPISLNLGGASFQPLEYDLHQRVWGLKYLGEIGEQLSRKYSPELNAQVQAYCDGVNTYIKLNPGLRPVELQVLNYHPEEFRVADVLSLGLFFGTMLGANYFEELFRYVTMKEYGYEMVWKLAPFQTELGPTIIPPEMLKNKLAVPDPDLLKGTPRPEDYELNPKAALALAQLERRVQEAAGFAVPLSSNNWAVMGKLTKDGNAILCNDPHLSHMEPSLFYLMRVKGAGFDSFGVTFPGEPYLVLGHTRKLAWAATTTRADVQDVYLEKVNPNNPGQYLYQGEWKNFVEREEELKIRIGFSDKYQIKKIKVKQSIHGPILNSTLPFLPAGTPPVALRWTGWDFGRDLRVFRALVESKNVDEFMGRYEQLNREQPIAPMNIAVMYNYLMKGKNIADFQKAMDSIVVPNQNWLAADADGHIAYIPGGLVPIRSKGRGLIPVPGWTGEYEWTGFIPLSELPYAIDPQRGYIATANNRVVDMQWYPYTFGSNYGYGWRAARIEELLQKSQPLDLDKMSRIQNDIYSKEGEMFAPLMVKAVEKEGGSDPRVKEAAGYLKDWDYQTDTGSVATTIYYATMWTFYENVLKDEFPPEFYQTYLSNRLFTVILQAWIAEGKSEFFDDKTSKDKVEDLDDMLVKSIGDAVVWLEKLEGKEMSEWKWGKLHTITFSHPLGIGPFKDFSVGPFPHPGADQTVRNASFYHNEKNPFTTAEGPVLRHIIDMGKPDQALMAIDGSESGKWLDPHYKDLHQVWFEGKYVNAVMDEAQVKKNAQSMLILTP